MWSTTQRRNGIIAAIIFFIVMLPLVFNNNLDIFDEADEQASHYPVILQFAEQFPTPSLDRYASATGPMYHLFMMPFVRFFNLSLEGLRVINLLLSIVCIGVVYWSISKGNEPNFALLLTACFMLSPYFIGAAVRLSTDNFALLFAFATIVILNFAPFSTGKYIVAALTATLATLTRQLHLWLVGAGVIHAWGMFNQPLNARIRNSLFFILPVFLLGLLILAWGGLAPPMFQGSYQTQGLIHPRALGYALAVLGQYSIFFWPWLWRFFRENKGQWWHIAVVIGVTAIFLVIFPVAPETGVVTNENEGGILWSLTGRFPIIRSSSVIFWVLVPVGTLSLYAVFLSSHHKKNYWMLLFAVLWLISNMASARVYQKYYEPFWLFFLGYIVKDDMDVPRWFWAFPALLCLILAGIDITRFYI